MDAIRHNPNIRRFGLFAAALIIAIGGAACSGSDANKTDPVAAESLHPSPSPNLDTNLQPSCKVIATLVDRTVHLDMEVNNESVPGIYKPAYYSYNPDWPANDEKTISSIRRQASHTYTTLGPRAVTGSITMDVFPDKHAPFEDGRIFPCERAEIDVEY